MVNIQCAKTLHKYLFTIALVVVIVYNKNLFFVLFFFVNCSLYKRFTMNFVTTALMVSAMVMSSISSKKMTEGQSKRVSS